MPEAVSPEVEPHDEVALAELVALISRGVDRRDPDAVASCYAADSVDHHGEFVGMGRELADYLCRCTLVSGRARFLRHSLGRSIFDVDGDRAFGETSFDFHMLTESDALFQGKGRYVDEFARRDRRWSVTRRRVVMDWSGLHQVTSAGG